MIRTTPINDGAANSSEATAVGRLIAIGDVHGCRAALQALLAQIQPTRLDTIVTLGDYIDRGPDSKGVLETLLALRNQCHLVPLLGNHEAMLFSARSSQAMFQRWLTYGGLATLASYQADDLHVMPLEHSSFLDSCRLYYETATHFFIHANYDPTLPLGAQNEDIALSLSLFGRVPGPHLSGKTAIVGHTAQLTGEILDLGYLKCIDTNCWDGGWLTAIDVGSGQVWQARESPALLAGGLDLPLGRSGIC
ncbi:MAG TPA: metallophosphoesterase family protein [Pirellulales bacterium]|nr:metallophosphoesterase family protein [Pirellulales bacterium]